MSRTSTGCWKALAGAVLLGQLALAGCGASPEEWEQYEESEQAVVNGQETFARPEVAQFKTPAGFGGLDGGNCTATMISAISFVTAAHCVDYFPLAFGGDIHLDADVDLFRDTTVEATYSMGDKFGKTDLAIGFLTVANPPEWNWSSALHYAEFPSALWTKMGYGCNTRSNPATHGVPRYREGSGSNSKFNCKGDSGGPLFAGGLFDWGGIAMVASMINSNGVDVDAYADPVWIEGMHRELSTPAYGPGYELSWDRRGWDFQTIANIDADVCRNRCLANPGCQAFTTAFDDRGGSTCWLKSVTASADPLPRDILSGVSEGSGRFDLPGGDLLSRSEPNVEACEAHCANHPFCRAYSYTDSGTCWIKNTVPAFATNSRVQSGTRRDLEASIDRPGMDLSAFSSASAGACSLSCSRDDKCDAFSYTSGICYLKTGIPAPVGRAGITSGLRRGIEFNSVRNGTLIREFDLGDSPLRRCQSECNRSFPNCKAWSAALPSARAAGTARKCRLFSTVGTRTRLAGSTSGRGGMDFF